MLMLESPLSKHAGPIALVAGGLFALMHVGQFLTMDDSDPVAMVANPAFQFFGAASTPSTARSHRRPSRRRRDRGYDPAPSRRNIRMLGNGLCTRPAEFDCRMETVCETCAWFTTGPEFVAVLLRHRVHARDRHQIDRANHFDTLIEQAGTPLAAITRLTPDCGRWQAAMAPDGGGSSVAASCLYCSTTEFGIRPRGGQRPCWRRLKVARPRGVEPRTSWVGREGEAVPSIAYGEVDLERHHLVRSESHQVV
jgi:hypothetical protein